MAYTVKLKDYMEKIPDEMEKYFGGYEWKLYMSTSEYFNVELPDGTKLKVDSVYLRAVVKPEYISMIKKAGHVDYIVAHDFFPAPKKASISEFPVKGESQLIHRTHQYSTDFETLIEKDESLGMVKGKNSYWCW